jgi:phosphatidylglycerophosphate synthase
VQLWLRLLWASYWLVFAATVLTIYSGISYLYKNRHVFSKDVGISD